MFYRRVFVVFIFLIICTNTLSARFFVAGSAGATRTGLLNDAKAAPIDENAVVDCITIDESNAQITVASCSVDNGSVTGIVVTGATQYQWVNAGGTIVGIALNLQNVGPGMYTLTASNGLGCSATSKTYAVGQQPPTQFPVYPADISQACTGKSNGGVSVTVDNLVKLETWVNNLEETINTGIGIANVPAGIYQLYLTDQNGCQSLYATYEVPNIPQLVITQGSGQITDDQCSGGAGSIKNIIVSGGRPPYTYAWLDASGNKIGSSLDISGLAAGSYTFTVNDQTTCGLVSALYTIQNQDIAIPAPIVNNLQVCSPGEALLQVKNTSSGYSYNLYDAETSTNPIDVQPDGSFKINVKTNSIFYVSQFLGECESSRTAATITVGLSSADIANTFTPNGDGINDYWQIESIQNYPSAMVQVFTRNGQKVFESRGYATPFDGTYSGKKLPDGVYYYIINLNTSCNLLSGSLTIIR